MVAIDTPGGKRFQTIKLEYARRGFYFMGAKLYNELPLNIRSATSSEDFYKLLKLHFS